MPIPDDAPCRQLADFRLATTDDADAATTAALAEHLETCPHCRQVDLDVAALLATYGRSTPEPLGAAREHHLLDCMCGPARPTTAPPAPESIHEADWSHPMMTVPASYAFGTTLDLPLDAAITALTAALKAEGFGILTQIDVAATLQQKLDVSFEPYVILGACNPALAHQALTAVHDIGLLLPCNIIVHAHGAQTRIDVADPIAMLALIPDPQLTPIATQARDHLQRAIQALGGTNAPAA